MGIPFQSVIDILNKIYDSASEGLKVLMPVAPADSIENNTVADVIGNKDDNTLSTPGNDSLYGIAGFMAYYHVHSPAKVYPDLAEPINVVSASAAWTYGGYSEIVPAGVITEAFDIHWIHTGELSATGNYQLELSSGTVGNEVVIGTIAFSRDSNQVQSASQPIQIPPRFAGTRISARLATGNASANSLDMKIYYHEYPA